MSAAAISTTTAPPRRGRTPPSLTGQSALLATREKRALPAVAGAAAPSPTINEVSFGKSRPRDFDLGGRQGNVVIASADSRVHKGWRLVGVDGLEVGALHTAPQVGLMLSHAARKGKYTLAFAGEKPSGGGAAGTPLVAPTRRPVAAGAAAVARRAGTPTEAAAAAAAAEARRVERAEAEARRAERERREAEEKLAVAAKW